MPALLKVWRITAAGEPARELEEREVVENVEALCRGVIAEISRSTPMLHDDVEETLGHLLCRVVVLVRTYDPTRAGILFRPWLYQYVRWEALEFQRKWFGRRGQKRLVDARVAKAGLRDAGVDDGDRGLDRLSGPPSPGTGDRPEDRTSPLGWLYAQGDRATLREERRLGLDQGARAPGGDPRAGTRASGRDAGGAQGGAAQAHWLDCSGCGWRNYRVVAPNGVSEWHFPEACLACGEALVVARAEGLLRVA